MRRRLCLAAVSLAAIASLSACGGSDQVTPAASQSDAAPAATDTGTSPAGAPAGSVSSTASTASGSARSSKAGGETAACKKALKDQSRKNYELVLSSGPDDPGIDRREPASCSGVDQATKIRLAREVADELVAEQKAKH